MKHLAAYNNLWELGAFEHIAPGHFLLREGEPCHDLFYIHHGIVRVYYLKNGKELTDWFGTRKSMVTCMKSFYSGKGSGQFIQALTPCTISRINRQVIEKEVAGNDRLNQEYISLLTHHLMRLHQRIKALQFYPARERFDLLAARNPEVIQYAPKSAIASYLGMSVETLRRVSSFMGPDSMRI